MSEDSDKTSVVSAADQGGAHRADRAAGAARAPAGAPGLRACSHVSVFFRKIPDQEKNISRTRRESRRELAVQFRLLPSSESMCGRVVL